MGLIKVATCGSLDMVSGMKKNSDMLDGKRALMVLPSQVTRNGALLNKVGEFIACILATQEEHAFEVCKEEIQIAETLRVLSEARDIEITAGEKRFEREVGILVSEISDLAVSKRKETCQSLLTGMDEGIPRFLQV
jgi:methylthioribose-1-phosphate isomerase